MKKKSYAKVNIFLKIAGKREDYHKIVSRFVRVKNLFDTIEFVETNSNKFEIEGNFGCELESNTIYKAYELIKSYKNVEKFFEKYSIKVDKTIPEFAGLGGGSSNAATFLIMANEYCDLNLSKKELRDIAVKIGADVPFFIYEYDSANVSGIGEIVDEFEEDALDIEVLTPNILCDTGKIFKIFRDKYYKEISFDKIDLLFKMTSVDILNNLSIEEANDLYMPAVEVNPDLKKYKKERFFFSGSGSSFFKLNNGGNDG